MLSSAPAGPMGSLQNDEARRRSVCQEEILPDTAEASPVFFWCEQSAVLSTFLDIACTQKLWSLPLITVLVNAVIPQNVTITSLCYLQGGFMLCLHLETALLADIYFSP